MYMDTRILTVAHIHFVRSTVEQNEKRNIHLSILFCANSTLATSELVRSDETNMLFTAFETFYREIDPRTV